MWPLLSRNWFSQLIFLVTLLGWQRDRQSAWRSGLDLRVVLHCFHSQGSGQPYSECCTFSVFMFNLLEKQLLSRIHFPSKGSSAWFLSHRIGLQTSFTLAELWKTNHKCCFLFCHLPLFLFSPSFHIEFYSLIYFSSLHGVRPSSSLLVVFHSELPWLSRYHLSPSYILDSS